MNHYFYTLLFYTIRHKGTATSDWSGLRGEWDGDGLPSNGLVPGVRPPGAHQRSSPVDVMFIWLPMMLQLLTICHEIRNKPPSVVPTLNDSWWTIGTEWKWVVHSVMWAHTVNTWKVSVTRMLCGRSLCNGVIIFASLAINLNQRTQTLLHTLQ